MMPQQHNILFLATEYESGMRSYAFTIIHNMWNEHSHAIVVIKDEKYKHDFDDLDLSRVHFIHYPTCKLKKLIFRFRPTALKREILRILSEEKIDIIYSLTGELVLSNSINRIQKHVPVLYTVHDAIPHETKLPLIAKLKERYIVVKPQQSLFKKTPYKITNSKVQYEYVKQHIPNSKHVYYAPFPSLMNDDIAHGDLKVKETEGINNYILFFGNIHLYKGVDLLYNCYLLHPELHNHALVLAGSGTYYFNCVADEKKVVCVNRFVDDRELADLFKKASVVVYPYISATQSGVISLASFFNKPIVLSNVGYFKEVASGYPGITFFESGNLGDMAKAIGEALATQESSEKIFHDVYSPSRMAESVNGIIHHLMRKLHE